GLINNLRGEERFDQWLARAVESRQLRAIDPNLAIVDGQAVQGSEHVLDHFDLRSIACQRCAAGNFDPLPHIGGNSPRWIEIAAHKDNAAMRRRRTKLDLHVAAAPVTEARHCTWASKRSLVSQGCRQGC